MAEIGGVSMKFGDIELTDWMIEGDNEHLGVSHVRKIVGRKEGLDHGIAIWKSNDHDSHFTQDHWEVYFLRDMSSVYTSWAQFSKSMEKKCRRFKTPEEAKSMFDEFERWMKLRSFE